MIPLTLRPPRNRVERRAAAWWTAQSSVFALPLPIVFGVLYLFIPPARGAALVRQLTTTAQATPGDPR